MQTSHAPYYEWFETRCCNATAFQLCLEYAIRRVQVNQDGLKLNDTYQLLVYVDEVNTLGRRVHTTKKTKKQKNKL